MPSSDAGELALGAAPEANGPDTAAPDAPVRLAWLRSQGFGLLCGQATVLLLAAGSFVMAHAPGVEAPTMDDVTAFVRAPSAWHLWFYLLVPVLALYALNTVLCTWDNVTRRWRLGQRAPSLYAPAVLHVAFLVALAAHGVGGLWGREHRPVMVGAAWKDLGDGRQARVLGLEEESHPDGSLRQIAARLEVRDGPSAAARPAEVSFNGPLSWGLGAELFLLADWGELPDGVRLRMGDAVCTATIGTPCPFSGQVVELTDLRTSGGPGGGPVAWLRAGDETFSLPIGYRRQLTGGATLVFDRLEPRPALLLRHRHAPGTPWALAAAVLLGLGTVMMGRRWL